MGGRVRCFMVERTERFVRSLRRYAAGGKRSCPLAWGYHNAEVVIDRVDRPGYEFLESDEWQINGHRLFFRPGETTVFTLREAPAGAMWFADFYDQIYRPQLEHCLVVKLPCGTEWCVDGQANNCTIADDHRQERHHCWVITGTLPDITVGKGGPTCAAGAGSIATGAYHGFLRAGYLEEC